MEPKNQFSYVDNDTPEEHDRDQFREYLFYLLPFLLVIFLATTAFILYYKQ